MNSGRYKTGLFEREAVGKFIMLKRQQAGFNRSQFAKRCMISRGTLINVENGTQMPCFWKMLSMLEILGCTIDDIKAVAKPMGRFVQPG